MKTLSKIALGLFVAVCMTITVKAQQPTQLPKFPIDETSKLITYGEVVQTTGNKDTLYNRCLGWVNAFYKNPASVTTKRDKENGIIECKHQFEVYNYDKDGKKVMPANSLIKYTLTIVFKDGRYKYTLTGLNIKAASYQPLEEWQKQSPVHDIHLKQVDETVKEIIKGLKQGMEGKKAVKKEEW